MAQSPIEYVHGHRDEFLAGVQELLRIPCISTFPDHCAAMRPVSGQNSDHIFALCCDHVQHLTPPGVRVTVHLHHGSGAVNVAYDSRWIRAARHALKETFDRDSVLTGSGGSIPIVGLFMDVPGIDRVLMGWGLADDNLHAPDEKISLANFYAGIDATIRFWEVAANDGV